MRRCGLLLVLLGVGLVAGCGGSAHTDPVPGWMRAERLPAAAEPGARLFAASTCRACHTYLGSGTKNLGAPDLTAVGARLPGVEREIEQLRCPTCFHPGSQMPKYDYLGAARLRELAVFLAGSKGRR